MVNSSEIGSAKLFQRRFFDIGVNITDRNFSKYNDQKEAIQRAKDWNVCKMLLTSSDLPSLKENLLYCEKDSGIYTTVGVHPLWCNVFEKNERNLSPEQYIEEMKEAYEQNKSKIIAFGEIGLDYDSKRLNYCSIELQKKYFELQLKLAKQLDLPLFLHARDNNACSDMFKIIKKIYHSTNEKKLFNGVVHSFTSDAQDAEIILENGCYIGLNGLSFKENNTIKAIESIPINKILMDSDSPYCLIKPSWDVYKLLKTKFETKKPKKKQINDFLKGRNEPAFIINNFEVLSEVKKVDLSELIDKVYVNSLNLFNVE